MRPFLILPLIALMGLSACQTVAGAGRDLQDAGEAITDESQEAQAAL